MPHSSPSIPPLAPGAKLGDRFEVLGILGEGGAGTVYDALRMPEHERIALKVLHGHLLGDRQLRGRFEREAKILARLQGTHLSPVLDSGEIQDPREETRTLLYIALPKIDGPALDTVLRREGPLPLPRVFDVFLQVCDALRSAHAQGVVHRDLKPANVLLRGGTHVVVVDFGLAKILAGDAAATVLTAHNMVCGTPEYMAPEQARGDDIDARCDVYAAGVMLYQMLTGDPPFQGTTPLAILTAHLTSKPIPPRERAPNRGISPALEDVVLHALAKSPADRYPSAAALAAAVLHARATPEDRESVKPDSFRLRVEPDADAHSPTQPSLPSESTKPAVAPLPSDPPPRRPSDRPPSHRSIPPLRTNPDPGTSASRTWTLIWVAATLASISVGIWLSLRTP